MKVSYKEVIDKFLRWEPKEETKKKKKDFEYICLKFFNKNEISSNILIVFNAFFVFFKPSNYC